MAKEVFNRYELKFIMDYNLYEHVLAMISEHLILDVYGDNEGYYTVINLYLDTEDNFFNQQIIDREKFRQKLRLRVYDGAGPSDPSFLEIKKKYDGVTNKRRTILKLSEANQYLGVDEAEISDFSKMKVSNKQVFREIEFFKNVYKLEPKMVLSYDRRAFHSAEEGGVRVTFDRNLRCRYDDLHLESGSRGELFVPEEFVIMEIKVRHSVPMWLVEMLNAYNIKKQRFSKYSHCVEWHEKKGKDFVSDYVIQTLEEKNERVSK